MGATKIRGKGEGAVYQRASDGLWCGTVELEPRNGKRRRRTVTARDKGVLIKKLAAERKRLEAHGDIQTTNTTVEQWLTYWLDNIVDRNARPNTASSYRLMVERHIVPEIGPVKLEKLTPTHIRRIEDAIIRTPKDPKDPDKGNLSSSTAAHAFRVLAASLSVAEEEGRIDRSPAKVMKGPRVPKPKLKVVTPEMGLAVLAYATEALNRPDYDPYPMRWASALFTGTRRGEMIGLTRECIDLDNDVLDLSWQLQRIKLGTTPPPDFERTHISGGLWLTKPKSDAGERVVPLIPELRAALIQHLERTPEREDGLVFSYRGRPIDPSWDSKQFPAILRGLGVEDPPRGHDLRHAGISLMYAAGVPEAVIQEIFGHASKEMSRAYRSRGNLAVLKDAMTRAFAPLTSNGDSPQRSLE